MRILFGVRGRLIAGFSVLCLLLAGSVGMTMVKVDALRIITDRMAQVRMPTALAASELATEIYASLTALRSWMISPNASVAFTPNHLKIATASGCDGTAASRETVSLGLEACVFFDEAPDFACHWVTALLLDMRHESGAP